MGLSIASLEEDSLERVSSFFSLNNGVCKFLCCVPLIGCIADSIIQSSLERRIGQTQETPKLISLIKLQNQYLSCSTFRNILTGILTIATFVGIIFFFIAHQNMKEKRENERLIKTIELSGSSFRQPPQYAVY